MIENFLADRPAAVLIVDDDRDARESLAALLESDGYPVAMARNGREALEYLRSHALPRLILLDLMMPGMDGWEFRARQLADPRFAAVPVVVMSGVPEDCQHVDLMDVSATFLKPCELSPLLQVIDRHCKSRASEPCLPNRESASVASAPVPSAVAPLGRAMCP